MSLHIPVPIHIDRNGVLVILVIIHVDIALLLTVQPIIEYSLHIGILRVHPTAPATRMNGVVHRAQRVVVVEKSFCVGLGGVVSTDVRLALSGLQLHGYTVVAGLGGRAITQSSLERMLREAIADKLEPLTFLDLDWRIVNRQLEREGQTRRSGPIAENLLRDVGPIAAKVA